MGRIRLKKKYIFHPHFKISEKIILVIILLIISLFIAFNYISTRVTPVLMNYAEIEARKFINAIINKAVSESKIDNQDQLFNLNKTDNEISTIDFNVNIVNELLTNISTKVNNNIKLMESGELTNISGYDDEKLKKGIIYEVPSGLIFKNDLLSNIGPKIPVKISMRGSILSNIDTSITNYGINNALVKVNVNLTLNEQVLLPFTLKTIEVDTSIPVVIKMVEGTVPKYYSGSLSNTSPQLSIPLEEN